MKDDYERTEFGLINRAALDGQAAPVREQSTPISDHNEAQKALLEIRATIDRLAEKPLIAIYLLVIEPGDEDDDGGTTMVCVGDAVSLIESLYTAQRMLLGDLMAHLDAKDD